MKIASPNESAFESPASSTRYGELASALIKDIVAGRHVVGGLLPTEHELAEQRGVSRHTVRAALKLLQDLGYISRKKSVGTVVQSANPDTAYTQSFGTVDDLVRVAATEIREIERVHHVTLDRATARRLEAPVSSEWLVFAGLRVDVRKGGTPVAWADIYIDATLSRIADTVRARPEVLVSFLIERDGGHVISEIRQVVTGTLIDAPLARRLNVDAGSAGLRLVRHYKDAAGKILEISDTVYPAGRVSVATQLKRSRMPG